MDLTENKGLVLSFWIIFALLVMSVLLNIYFKSGNYDYALKNNKVFNISVEKDKDSGQFVFSTKNHLRVVNNISKFIPNVSFIVFDIDSNNSAKIIDLLELQSDVRLGFINFNDSLLEKLKYFGHHFLLSLNFDENRVDNLFFDKNKTLEENEINIKKINDAMKNQNAAIYVHLNDLKFLDGNQKFVDFLLNLNPFIVGNNDGCNEQTKLCFLVSDDVISDSSLLKFQEILNQIKLNEKWFIAIKYSDKFEQQIKILINSTNNGFLNINKNLLDNIMKG